MTESTPQGSVRAGPIIGGLVLGAIVWLVWITVALVVGFGTAYGTESDAVAVATLVVAALPVLLAIVLIARPRTRQLGAGFLMGISIGFIAGAGVCVSLFIPGAF